MALDASKVDVAVTGTVSYAPVGSTAPTDATTALDAAFKDVGYISEDGVSEVRDRTVNNIVAWQASRVVRAVVTEASISVTFTMIESNPNSLELFYGSAVDPTGGGVEIDPQNTGGRRSLVVDYVDGAKFVRLYLPECEVTSVGEVALTNGEAVGYNVTVVGYPAASANNNSAMKWFSDLDTVV